MTCTRPTLATGTSAPSITVTVTAPGQGVTLSDTATVTSATTDPVPANNSSSASTTVTPSADLAITKTGPATVVAGGSVAYSLVVVNNGPSDASALSMTDTLPAGVTFVCATGHRLGLLERRQRLGDLHPARPWRPARPRRRSR